MLRATASTPLKFQQKSEADRSVKHGTRGKSALVSELTRYEWLFSSNNCPYAIGRMPYLKLR
jgi:hypothetical protein